MRLLSELSARMRATAWAHAGRSERGAALAEYVLLAGFIAIVVMIGVAALGQSVEPLFHTVAPTI